MNDEDKLVVLARLLDATGIVPGGVLPTDHWHHVANDDTCSRCRKPIPQDDVPVRLWRNREDMLIYCKACLGWA